jgi:SAM-dependent methyltransferase
MGRSHLRIIALALAAPLLLVPSSPRASDRALPMRFELRKGAAEVCSTDCKVFISASGAITAETPRHFLLFAQNNDLSGATLVIDSDGGSVLGAIALGREIRKLKLTTTVGRLVDVPGGKDEGRASLSTNADCESMCAFFEPGTPGGMTNDTLACRAAFKNFADPVGALDEIHRVLKPGGKASIFDLRKNASPEDIEREVAEMKLSALNRWLTRWTFRHMLIPRAYGDAALVEMTARTHFGRGEIVEDGVGFELRLAKRAA